MKRGEPLTVEALYQAQKDHLTLRWLAGRAGGGRPLEQVNARYPGLALVGYLSVIHPNRVQVLGENELRYLQDLDPNRRREVLDRLFTCDTSAMVVLAGGAEPLPVMLECAERHGMPLLASPQAGPVLIDSLQFYLANALAERITLHGVFLEVMGIGVLLTGESGVGKSEVALELISRGHRLVADDVVELSRVAPQLLEGRCPEPLHDFMEVRGLGILDIRAMFGETATKRAKYLRLIVHLEPMTQQQMQNLDRLRAATQSRTLLGVNVPEVVIPVAPGRNLAVLVETAARNHIQIMRGKNALHDFMEQQQAVMRRKQQPGPPPVKDRGPEV